MISRSVTVSYAQEFANENTDEVNRAVGYLSNWAINGQSGRYEGAVSIYGDKDGNLNANYRNKKGEVTYQIFGLMGEDGSYSFHS